jgi:hypothetical protein
VATGTVRSLGRVAAATDEDGGYRDGGEGGG